MQNSDREYAEYTKAARAPLVCIQQLCALLRRPHLPDDSCTSARSIATDTS
jgi:hypothetical protein